MRFINIEGLAYKQGLCPACLSKVEWCDAYYDKDDWGWYSMTYHFICPKCKAHWEVEYTIDHARLYKED